MIALKTQLLSFTAASSMIGSPILLAMQPANEINRFTVKVYLICHMITDKSKCDQQCHPIITGLHVIQKGGESTGCPNNGQEMICSSPG